MTPAELREAQIMASELRRLPDALRWARAFLNFVDFQHDQETTPLQLLACDDCKAQIERVKRAGRPPACTECSGRMRPIVS